MKGTIAAVGVLVAAIRHCWIRAGTRAGRWREKMQRKGELDADSRKGVPEYRKERRQRHFWREEYKGCSQKECCDLYPEEHPKSGKAQEKPPFQESGEMGDCKCCPYDRHFPCIGYCMQEIMRELGERKQAAGKEGNSIAGRSE